jgi:spore coat protein U-like protein
MSQSVNVALPNALRSWRQSRSRRLSRRERVAVLAGLLTRSSRTTTWDTAPAARHKTPAGLECTIAAD